MMDREAIQNWKIMHQMLFKLAAASLRSLIYYRHPSTLS